VIVQPEIKAQTPFVLAMYKLPSYHFPVASVSSTGIQSFWGADRGGRLHEGIDIFAKRGTPVVAATEGRISFVGERGNGGKQVWLRAGMFGHSLYYAHLDSIAVSTTDRVQAGDTLGFVGNTGNALTTTPHLHFGIYRIGGAIDPLPFVLESEVPKLPKPPAHWRKRVVVTATAANLRNAASAKGEKIGEVRRADTLQLLGLSGDWWHVKTTDQTKAFIHKRLAN
jgi:murein DD-endopeptidase MepM/ murein hydrolase activator NlpD